MNTADIDNNCVRAWAIPLAVLGACLIFALLVLETKKYTQPPPVDEGRAAVRAKALAELRAADAEALGTVGWVDQAKGVVRLPIAEAIKLVEREWQNPAQARSNLIARVEKATALPPKPPEKPSPFE
jgi:nucleotide-binding universal stress UspA family protein